MVGVTREAGSRIELQKRSLEHHTRLEAGMPNGCGWKMSIVNRWSTSPKPQKPLLQRPATVHM